MKTILQLILLSIFIKNGICSTTLNKLPDNIGSNEIIFIYVHGFGELYEIVPFEKKMRKFLKPLPLKSTFFTYRWDWLKIDLTKVVYQWNQAKIKADRKAKFFMGDILLKLEAKKLVSAKFSTVS